MIVVTLISAALLGLVQDPLPEVSVQSAALGLSESTPRVRCVRTWRGERNGSQWTLDLRCVPLEPGQAEEPELVVELLRTTRRAPSWCCSRFPGEAYAAALVDEAEPGEAQLAIDLMRRPWAAFGETTAVSGPYGIASRGAHAEGLTTSRDATHLQRQVGRRFVLAGLVEGRAWVLELDAEPAPDDTVWKATCQRLLASVEVQGKPRVARWSDEELIARWTELGVDAEHRTPRIRHTKHFAVVGNASFGAALLRRIEDQYERVQSVLGFAEEADRRELVIFLFRRPEEYWDATGSRYSHTLGLAWHDIAATWYRSPGDHVLAHEIVHQLQRNRAFQSGGTPFISEGLAEALSRPATEWRVMARNEARRFFLPRWKAMSGAWSLANEEAPQSTRPSSYERAGLAMEFLRQTAKTPESFQRFLRAACLSARSDGASLEQALIEHYGCEWTQLEELWGVYHTSSRTLRR